MGTQTTPVSNEGAQHPRLKKLNQKALGFYPWFPRRYLDWIHDLERGRVLIQVLAERQAISHEDFRISQIELDLLVVLYQQLDVTVVTFKFLEIFIEMADELVSNNTKKAKVAIAEWIIYSRGDTGAEKPRTSFEEMEGLMARIYLLIDG